MSRSWVIGSVLVVLAVGLTACKDNNREILMKDCLAGGQSEAKCKCRVDFEQSQLSKDEFETYAKVVAKEISGVSGELGRKFYEVAFRSGTQCRGVQ